MPYADSVLEDVQLIWSNCRQFNTIPDSFILKACDKAEEKFNKLWIEADLPEMMSGGPGHKSDTTGTVSHSRDGRGSLKAGSARQNENLDTIGGDASQQIVENGTSEQREEERQEETWPRPTI